MSERVCKEQVRPDPGAVVMGSLGDGRPSSLSLLGKQRGRGTHLGPSGTIPFHCLRCVALRFSLALSALIPPSS